VPEKKKAAALGEGRQPFGGWGAEGNSAEQSQALLAQRGHINQGLGTREFLTLLQRFLCHLGSLHSFDFLALPGRAVRVGSILSAKLPEHVFALAWAVNKGLAGPLL
jgi:hypothetical protein